MKPIHCRLSVLKHFVLPGLSLIFIGLLHQGVFKSNRGVESGEEAAPGAASSQEQTRSGKASRPLLEPAASKPQPEPASENSFKNPIKDSVPTLSELVQSLASLEDLEIEDEVQAIEKTIKKDQLIERTNQGMNSQAELHRLQSLMQKRDALLLVKAQRQIDELQSIL